MLTYLGSSVFSRSAAVSLLPLLRRSHRSGYCHRSYHRRGLRLASYSHMANYTSSEERRWNRMGDHMNSFHNWFKQEYNTVYQLADGSFTKRLMSLKDFLDLASDLITHLNFHHSIEEAHIFPVLSKRMPEFAPNSEHLASHRAIHAGLDDLAALVKKYTNQPSSYSPTEMKACLDGFRKVLFDHLDQEVLDLKATNMKKYWSLEEVDRLVI